MDLTHQLRQIRCPNRFYSIYYLAMESPSLKILVLIAWLSIKEVFAACNTAALTFSGITAYYVGETVNLASYISDLTGCTVTNFAISVLPTGAVVDAATGSFSWTPSAGTTPIKTQALLDEGSTYTASSMGVWTG